MHSQEQKWNKKDLERRLCHALDIAQQAIEQLACAGYTDAEEPSLNVRPEKLVSETALLLLAASTAAYDDGVKARIDRVARLLLPHARSERMLLGMSLHPALTLDYAQAHICLSRLGYGDASFDTLLSQSSKSQAHAGRERVPHRMLEQEWITHVWKNSRSGSRRHTPAAALDSVLNQPMDLLNGSREDLYAFTHALMYVRNFNISPLPLPRSRTRILAEAEAALARCLDEQDYDLGGEVLLSWPLTGKSWSAASAFGFRILTSVEDTAGFLPAASTRLDRLQKLEGDHRMRYLLATAYHTAYVMGLLCAAALQPGRTPPSTIPVTGAVRGGADRLLHLLDDGSSTHWRNEFDRLTGPERDALAGLLLNVALRRMVSRGEFGSVRELLGIGHALGLADTPASSQAAEMLERLTTFARIRQAPATLCSAPL